MTIKYLQVMIDSQIDFKKHLDWKFQETSNTSKPLARTMPNIAGPRYYHRLPVVEVDHSSPLYAVSVWYERLTCQNNRKRVNWTYPLVSGKTFVDVYNSNNKSFLGIVFCD